MNVETARMYHHALDAGASGFTHETEVRDALRGVITMHQPTGDRPGCRHCSALAPDLVEYPCRTITAIGAALRIRITTTDTTDDR